MSVPDSVGKCPPLSEEVLDRAVEAGRKVRDELEAESLRQFQNGILAGIDSFGGGICAAAPVIAEAGYRAGIEAARAAVEDCAVDYEGTPITEVHRDDLRDALAALTDTEGRDE